ncbi:hypothetical protein [Cloacibacterium normanense]|uniref:hypothetical protein n=1 Tax=Cloacibacterium normanense TaxID=237258 RepID=UPI00352E1D8A
MKKLEKLSRKKIFGGSSNIGNRYIYIESSSLTETNCGCTLTGTQGVIDCPDSDKIED